MEFGNFIADIYNFETQALSHYNDKFGNDFIEEF